MQLTEENRFKWAQYGILLLAFCSILPFLVLTLYNHPSADDYGFALRDMQKGFWAIQKEYYLHWSGRYFGTAILQLNPLLAGSFSLYKLYSFLLICAFIGTVYFFLYSTLQNALSLPKILTLTALILTTYLLQCPDITEAFYWLTGFLGYQVPNILFLLLLCTLLTVSTSRSIFKKTFAICLAVILAIMIIGSNEMALIMLNTTLAFIVYSGWQAKSRHPKFYVFLFIVCLSASIFMIGAPGNYIRMQEHHNAQRPAWSVLYASILTVIAVYKWSLPLIGSSLVFMFLFSKKTQPYFSRLSFFHVNIRVGFLFYFVTLFLMHFAFVWATGDRPTPRVENVIYFFFVLGWFYLLLVTLSKHTFYFEFTSFPAKLLLGFILSIYTLQVVDIQNNIGTAYIDLLTGKASAYDLELKNRYHILKESTCQSCPLPTLTALPATVFLKDITTQQDSINGWVNEGVASYWKKEAVYLENANPPIEENMQSLERFIKKRLSSNK